MPITKEEKVRRVALYKESIAQSEGIILTNYIGMDTTQINELKGQLREVGGNFMIVKNTLLRIALKDLGLPVSENFTEGPTAISFGKDLTKVAKKLIDYSKNVGLPGLKGAILGNRILKPEEVETLAKLPSREELLGQLVGALQSPVYGLVYVLGGIIRSLIYVLQARAKQLETQS
ncbi:MAG: 50S ribosomal protein L10 [Anaerolineae bacterium]|nr:50S ribosomal protein L10 [Anaerolineae bacterium]MDW8102677.1 50S ribosomal protein L10 [Anaerolineae bacterium]